MDQFINSRETLVTEALDGVLRTANGALVRLDGYPSVKVIARADWRADKVALISGGGSGHEPAHAGFVGRGMLTAAVCGEVFASPSVDAVLAGILAVTGNAGCLLIVKNYTGDRLNFGLAAERARDRGVRVEMVVVDDDIALPDLAQPRGVAGTLFVHKIAGALAERGADLPTVTEAVRAVIRNVASIGMSLDTCALPGAAKETRIPQGKAELGLGIHGEPGVETVSFSGAREAIGIVLDRLRPKLSNGPHVALLNNLGGCTPLEMGVLLEELARSDVADRVTHVIGPAALMTSLDMRGFSLSTLPLDAAHHDALAATVAPAAWPGLIELRAPALRAMPEGLTPIRAPASAEPTARAVLGKICAALIESEAALNSLDAKSGDGDTGSTLATAARALRGKLDELPLADRAALLRALSHETSAGMGGSSGVLLAILFAAASEAAADGADWAEALLAGAERVQEVGGAGAGDRTMLDALLPALDALRQGSSLAGAAEVARAGAAATAEMARARAGRASYVASEALKGNRDPGAEAVARVFSAL